ncbi:ABC transporter permease subunit [Lysinibacillus fusiformis]|nr:ABC transporter permease subunit [Lysinibacillus fusiformis]
MNVFIHELKAYRKSTFVWTFSLIAIVVLFMSMFPAISKDITDFKKILGGFPEPVRKALGLEIENFGTILGFYSYMFVYLTLCGAIQAMHIGTSIVSKEVRDKTADFLLTKPVSRTKILTAKLLAVLTSVIMTNIVFLLGTTIMIAQVQTQSYSMKNFLLISLTLFFIQLIFLALGILVSIVFPNNKSVLTVSLGTVFTFFIIGILISTSGDGIKRYLSPFKYFEPAYIIDNSSYEMSYVLVGIGIVMIALGTSYSIYIKKDI